VKRRLVTIGHSYVVALNRRLAHELARARAGTWEVTAVAPQFVHGDLRPIRLEALPDEANHLRSLPVYGSRKPHILLYSPQLDAVLRQTPWDLIHAWQEPFTLPAAQIALGVRRWAKLVVVTAQNLSKRYPPPFNWIERAVMARAAGWIAFGHTIAANLHVRPGYARPHAVIPMGVDTQHFFPDAAAGVRIRSTLGWNDGPPVVGYLGRFVPEKGLRLLQQALTDLPVPWRALFVGGGPLTSELQHWAQTQGDRVRVVTNVPHNEVPAYLNAMAMLVAPSQTTPVWREQFGRMLVEAFACGVPVVGSSSGEIPQVIGTAGRVVAEADTAAWTQTLTQLLSEVALRQQLSEAGRARAEACFAWPVVARAHWDFFDRVCVQSAPQ
jgi:glycosyltransferase involved in cell wall biosynthesis